MYLHDGNRTMKETYGGGDPYFLLCTLPLLSPPHTLSRACFVSAISHEIETTWMEQRKGLHGA